MMKTLLPVVATAAALLLSQSVFAGPDCSSAPKNEWMSPMDMQKKIINEYGFSIDKFKVTKGNCYEIYGRNAEGRIEVYFNPINGEIVKQKKKG